MQNTVTMTQREFKDFLNSLFDNLRPSTLALMIADIDEAQLSAPADSTQEGWRKACYNTLLSLCESQELADQFIHAAAMEG